MPQGLKRKRLSCLVPCAFRLFQMSPSSRCDGNDIFCEEYIVSLISVRYVGTHLVYKLGMGRNDIDINIDLRISIGISILLSIFLASLKLSFWRYAKCLLNIAMRRYYYCNVFAYVWSVSFSFIVGLGTSAVRCRTRTCWVTDVRRTL